jgi:AraC-like DNA-binding protein
MNTAVCSPNELGAILADQPPYNYLDAAARLELSRTFHARDCQPGDLLAQEGRSVVYVGFVQSGVFDIYSHDVAGMRHRLGSLHAKEFFGDLSIMLDGIALGSLICRDKGRCYLQAKSDFYQVLACYESLHTFFLQNSLNKLWSIYQQIQLELPVTLATAAAPFEIPRVIEKALAYIEQNFKQPMTLEEMSRDVGLSRYHLSRTFKQHLGKSFKAYLTERRIAEAKLLMTHADKNVTEACFAVGFNDTSYFARVFRKYEGLSPSTFRKRVDHMRRQSKFDLNGDSSRLSQD